MEAGGVGGGTRAAGEEEALLGDEALLRCGAATCSGDLGEEGGGGTPSPCEGRSCWVLVLE